MATPAPVGAPIAAGPQGADKPFFPVSGLSQSPLAPKVINAAPVDPADWPASFYSRVEAGSCTSTLVGPDVLLTAAHCIGPAGTISIMLRSGQIMSGLCENHPKYQTDISADYAYCKLNTKITGFPYENINQSPSGLRVGGSLLMTGYGCTTTAGTGGNDNVYRAGYTTIATLPPNSQFGPNYVTTRGGATLCFGDSGGSTFLVNTGSGRRWVQTVNSRTETINNVITGTSYLSTMSSDDARGFTADWKFRKGSQICGVDPITGCRP